MKNSLAVKTLLSGLLLFVFCGGMIAQLDLARMTTAITYPLDETVQIQFRGTTRFPRMKGSAKVKRTTRTGSRIELNVDNMPRPFELGAGYATYVLWAISPTGHADNLGEIKRSGLFFIDSKMTVTTNLQTFALLITAEPHFLVTRPSQTVMLENLPPVNPKGTLVATAPAVTYFGNSSDYFRDPRTPAIAETDYAKTPPAILQAIQAVALARFAGAERDAPTELAEAETLLQNAQNSFAAGRDSEAVDIAARKAISAAVRAESLAGQRMVAREQRNERTRSDAEIRAAENRFSNAQDEINSLKEELAREIRNRELAERDAMNYSNQLREVRAENVRLSEDLGRSRVANETANAKLAAIEEERNAIREQNERESNRTRLENAEKELLGALKAYGPVVKNERGIVLTLPENLWTGIRSSSLTPQADGRLASLAGILADNPDYRILVESHTDNSGAPDQVQTVTDRRSYAVADKFASLGVEEGRIVAKGLGATNPVAPNTTNANRAKNRRIQVILSLHSTTQGSRL
jgi:outer membrane protein OmpA-like peptidoglycan-associated protein